MAVMDPKIKLRWIDALTSGEYEQGVMTLRKIDPEDGKTKYCCLGVLAELHRQEMNTDDAQWVERPAAAPAIQTFSYDGGFAMPSPRVIEWAGLTPEFCHNLTVLNDVTKLDFKQIARFIDCAQ